MNKITKTCLIATAVLWGAVILGAVAAAGYFIYLHFFDSGKLPDQDSVSVCSYSGKYEFTLQIDAKSVYQYTDSVAYFDTDRSLEDICAGIVGEGADAEIVNGYLVIEPGGGSKGFYAVYIGEDGRCALMNLSAGVRTEGGNAVIPLPYFYVDFARMEGDESKTQVFLDAGESLATNAAYAEWKEFYADAVEEECIFDDAAQSIVCGDIRLLFADEAVVFTQI